MNGAEVLVEELSARGVRHVFGLPGDEVVVLEALRRSTLDFVVARHEQAAAFMADVYARVSGRPAVCLSTLGPGATNLVTGIANAFLDRSPVIAVSGQVPSSQLFDGVHQYVDLEALFRPITKWSTTVIDGRAIASTLGRAFDVAMTERKGPVHLSLPADVLAGEVSSGEEPAALCASIERRSRPLSQPLLARSVRGPARARRAGSSRSRVGKAAGRSGRWLNAGEDCPDGRNWPTGGPASAGPADWRQVIDVGGLVKLLQQAEAPIAIVGNLPTRVGANAELVDLIEAYQVPTFTTYMGKGAIPEDHPLSLGVISRHAGRQLREVFVPADLVVTFGFDYVEGVKPSLWNVGRPKLTVYVDSSAESSAPRTPADVYLIGDLKWLLREASASQDGNGRSCWLDVARARLQIGRRIQTVCGAGNGAILPQHAISAIRQVADKSAIVVSDVGLNKYAVGLCFEAREPGTVLFSNGLSAMGFSLPGAIGAQLARSDAQVISISGDGGFLMNVQELETGVRRRLPVVAVVFRDNSLGLIKRLQEDQFGQTYAVDLVNPDLPALARSFGALGIGVARVSELPAALEAALASGQTAVIDVPVSYEHWLR